MNVKNPDVKYEINEVLYVRIFYRRGIIQYLAPMSNKSLRKKYFGFLYELFKIFAEYVSIIEIEHYCCRKQKQ